MAKVIAIMNEKGGVGKTATATTLAYLLSQRGHRTALIDFDGQGHSSIIFGVKTPTN
jgi:chromosome partitioning protein